MCLCIEDKYFEIKTVDSSHYNQKMNKYIATFIKLRKNSHFIVIIIHFLSIYFIFIHAIFCFCFNIFYGFPLHHLQSNDK